MFCSFRPLFEKALSAKGSLPLNLIPLQWSCWKTKSRLLLDSWFEVPFHLPKCLWREPIKIWNLSKRTRLSKEVVPLLQADSAGWLEGTTVIRNTRPQNHKWKGHSLEVWHPCCNQLSLCLLIFSRWIMLIIEGGFGQARRLCCLFPPVACYVSCSKLGRVGLSNSAAPQSPKPKHKEFATVCCG